jgi:hypothetical protein
MALERRPESDPTSYAHLLNEAYPQIAAFGGAALQMAKLESGSFVQAVVIVALVSRFAFDVGGRRRQVEAAEEDLTTPDDDSVPVGEV